MNVSPSSVLGSLVIKVKSPMADLHEDVSCTDEFRIEDDLAPEKFFIKLDAPIDIRSKDMNMMDVASQSRISFLTGSLLLLIHHRWLNVSDLTRIVKDKGPYHKSGIQINLFDI